LSIWNRLRGLKMDQEGLETRLSEYHAPPRRGGKRDKIERVWRNAVIQNSGGNKPLIFSHDWSVPKTGRILLDFVEITKGASHAEAATRIQMDALHRQVALIRALIRPADHSLAMLRACSDFLSQHHVTCEHVSELLQLFKEPEVPARTSLFVKA